MLSSFTGGMALVAVLAVCSSACSSSSASQSSTPGQTSTPAPGEHAGSSTKTSAAKNLATAEPAISPDGHTFKMKVAQVMDQHGFERPIVAASMLIPVDWQSHGDTTWNIRDRCNTVQITLEASGPDGRAYEVLPTYNWAWADDPAFLRQSFLQAQQFGTHACDVQPPLSASDYIKQNIGRLRPGVSIAALEPVPDLLSKFQDQAHKSEQMAAQFGLRQQIRPDLIRARLKYSINGQAVEEWIYTVVVVTATLGPGYNPRTMQMTQTYSYACTANVVAVRAPQGKLDASEKFFTLMSSTYHLDQEWQNRIAANAQAIQQIELKGARDRANIIAKNGEDIRQMQQQGFENRQRAQDQSFKEFDQVIRGVESYRNPGTGETVELDSNYGHAWVSGSGVYLLSDQAGFNPNTVSRESWTPLEHVKP